MRDQQTGTVAVTNLMVAVEDTEVRCRPLVKEMDRVAS
jgi:hypothetical protein